MPVHVAPAGPADAAELAAVAAATFPLACPPGVARTDIDAFIAAHLSEPCFAGYLADPRRVVLAARRDGAVIGYAMLVRGDDRRDGPVELSKMYVLTEHHRTGAADELMLAGLRWAAEGGATRVWLGVNRANERAQRFYRRHGFAVTGTRTFTLGADVQNDYVMERPV